MELNTIILIIFVTHVTAPSYERARLAVAILFIRGAVSAGTPATTFVEILDGGNFHLPFGKGR